MGLAEWGARKIKKIGKKDDDHENDREGHHDDRKKQDVEPVAKRGDPYRDAPLVFEDLVKGDLEKVIKALLRKHPELEADFKGLVQNVRNDIKRQTQLAMEEKLAEKGRLLKEEQKVKLHETVKSRFDEHNKDKKFKKARKGIEWAKVWAKLEENPDKMWSLNEMERTGGEPDVVGFDEKTGEYIFMDCSKESPAKRRNICFNRVGQETAEKRGEKPAGNAVDMAREMGVQILREKEYRDLQELGNFDTQTWSWVVSDDMSEEEMEIAGAALFGNWFYDAVRVTGHDAVYHYGYGAFRGSLRV